MKLLGIDYGEAKVGLALGDSESKLALPYKIIKNHSRAELLKAIGEICKKENIEKIVVGVPVNGHVHSSAQLDSVLEFIKQLEKAVGIECDKEDESLTTRQAVRLANGKNEDDMAAMLILQAYLDRIEGGR